MAQGLGVVDSWAGLRPPAQGDILADARWPGATPGQRGGRKWRAGG
jgi:hypothetical protein